MQIKSFRDLKIWQEANSLSVEIYRITKLFPPEEKFGITSQIRRASFSVGANIAEGKGRSTRKDFVNFLYIARGSAQEVINFCLLSESLGFIATEDVEQIIGRYDGLTVGIQRCIEAMLRRPNKKTLNSSTAPSSAANIS